VPDESTGSVTVEGFDRLIRTLRKAGEDISDMKDANALAASMVASAASARAPRRTGALAGNVRGSRKAKGATVRAGGARVPYAGPIHWGWPRRHITAQPFISTAARDTEPRWVAAYLDAVQRALDNVKGA
jgi:hypothetical protein